MYMLQLFDTTNDAQPIDARLIRDGLMRIGRDSNADWSIPDPDCELSRAHCELEVAGGALRLRALGANGVFDDTTGERFADSASVAIAPPATLRFGRFRLKASHAPHGDAPIDGARTMVLTPPLGASTAVPDEWSDAASPAPPRGTGSLIEAFCEGAGLDASMLLSEDPTELMCRVGAVYRQMVLGIGDLMTERDRARAQYRMARTTIGGSGNNPFKWAPTQRLAIDLLLAGSGSFLSGPKALKASFRDIKRHLVATFAGLHGSLRVAIDTFDPAAIDAAVGGRGGLLKSRAACQVEEGAARHADLARQLDAGEGAGGGSLERAFVAAYDQAEARAAAGEA